MPQPTSSSDPRAPKNTLLHLAQRRSAATNGRAFPGLVETGEMGLQNTPARISANTSAMDQRDGVLSAGAAEEGTSSASASTSTASPSPLPHGRDTYHNTVRGPQHGDLNSLRAIWRPRGPVHARLPPPPSPRRLPANRPAAAPAKVWPLWKRAPIAISPLCRELVYPPSDDEDSFSEDGGVRLPAGSEGPTAATSSQPAQPLSAVDHERLFQAREEHYRGDTRGGGVSFRFPDGSQGRHWAVTSGAPIPGQPSSAWSDSSSSDEEDEEEEE